MTDETTIDTETSDSGNAPTMDGGPAKNGDAGAGNGSPINLETLNATLEYIRPALQADGGDLVLLGTDGGKVTLQLVGACGGCPMSTMTLTAGIERILRDRVPGVEEVVAI